MAGGVMGVVEAIRQKIDGRKQTSWERYLQLLLEADGNKRPGEKLLSELETLLTALGLDPETVQRDLDTIARLKAAMKVATPERLAELQSHARQTAAAHKTHEAGYEQMVLAFRRKTRELDDAARIAARKYREVRYRQHELAAIAKAAPELVAAFEAATGSTVPRAPIVEHGDNAPGELIRRGERKPKDLTPFITNPNHPWLQRMLANKRNRAASR